MSGLGIELRCLRRDCCHPEIAVNKLELAHCVIEMVGMKEQTGGAELKV